MALKAVLDSLEGAEEAVRGFYKQGSDGKFHLEIDGLDDHPDVGALRRAKDHEKNARKQAEDQIKQLTESTETLQTELDDIRRGAIPKADVEKLEASWKQKLEKAQGDLGTKVQAREEALRTMLVDNVAQSLASKISSAPELLLPHIRSRLQADLDGDTPVTKVLDKDGKPSALSIEELQQEFVANEAFAPVIIGSKASGGGASGGQSGGGAPQKLDYSKASPKEIAAHITAKKEAEGS